MKEKQVLNAKDIERSLSRIAHEILEKAPEGEPLGFIGVHTRGVPVAQRLHKLVSEFDPQREVLPVGMLDISFHRDDIHKGIHEPKVTDVPFDVNDKLVILADDVVYTGRTVRAALNAMLDLGRTRAIRLAALVDRGHRQLPIRADYVGKNLPTSSDEKVRVRLNEIDGEEGVWIEAPEAA